MTTDRPIFEDRERGFERDFARHEELAFRARALRNRLLARWASTRMHLAGEAAEKYADSVFSVEFVRSDDPHLVSKIVADLTHAGELVSDSEVWQALRQCGIEANRHVAEDL
jgi:hypothetical protein